MEYKQSLPFTLLLACQQYKTLEFFHEIATILFLCTPVGLQSNSNYGQKRTLVFM
jgi:hypothetical protein